MARRPDKLLVGVVCSLVVVLSYARLYFGVDLGDEAFHAVVAYRYALGARPFVDEVNVSQIGAGLVASPFVAAYHQVVGLDGIILFLRHLYFAFALGVAAAVFLSLRSLLGNALLALPISILAVAFVPQNLPSLNYNTLGNGFFVAGCFLGVASTRNPRGRYLFLAALAHALAVFVYPTLVVASAVYAAALFVLAGRSRSVLVAYVAVAITGALAWAAVLLHDGIDTARDVLGLAGAVAEGRDTGVERAISIVRDSAANFPLAPLALAAFVAAVALRRRRPRVAVGLLTLLPLLALPVLPSGGWTGEWGDLTRLQLGTSIHYVANLGLLAMPLATALRTDRLTHQLLIGIWLPALVAGAAVSWSTFSGGAHQGIGFFAGAIVAVVLLARAVSPVASTLRAPLLACLVPLAALVVLQYSAAAHDESPLRLHTRVGSGPYAGLLTAPENEELLGALDRDLRRTSHTRCGVLFYYTFPAGYLLTASPPETNTAFLWDREPLRSVYDRRLLRYYARRDEFPDVAVRLTRVPFMARVGRPRYEPDDPLDALIRGRRYERLTGNASYAIYARRAGPCASA